MKPATDLFVAFSYHIDIGIVGSQIRRGELRQTERKQSFASLPTQDFAIDEPGMLKAKATGEASIRRATIFAPCAAS